MNDTLSKAIRRSYIALRSIVEKHVDWFLENAPVETAMQAIEQVSKYDRFQVSQGIQYAAQYVCRRARELGLDDAEILQFDVREQPVWWTYRAPRPWSPRVARMELQSEADAPLIIDHSELPFSIALNSVATGQAGVRAPLALLDNHSVSKFGAILVLEYPLVLNSAVIAAVEAAGAIGFVTDAAYRVDADGTECAGRVELPVNTRIFAFSVTPTQMRVIKSAVLHEQNAYVRIEIDSSSEMPVVVGTLPGSGQEIWLTSHLCHPRPGANDNGSGVAALLAVANALREYLRHCKRHRTIRFFWGPEFVGLAAYLYQRDNDDLRGPLPEAVVNMDMVGEDQGLCQSPFLLERQPGCIPGHLTALAEVAVDLVFGRTSDEPGTWKSAPHHGFSDHFLFADPKFNCPAIQFCHATDRFNHSAADTLDKVSPLEMRRSIAIAASVVAALATSDLESMGGLRLTQHPLKQKDQVRLYASSTIFVARWPGPFNARAMVDDLPVDRRREVQNLIVTNKSNLAALNNIAIRAGRGMTRQQVLDEVMFELGDLIDHKSACIMYDALLEAHWCAEVAVS